MTDLRAVQIAPSILSAELSRVASRSLAGKPLPRSELPRILAVGMSTVALAGMIVVVANVL